MRVVVPPQRSDGLYGMDVGIDRAGADVPIEGAMMLGEGEMAGVRDTTGTKIPGGKLTTGTKGGPGTSVMVVSTGTNGGPGTFLSMTIGTRATMVRKRK